jgi:vacuolar protein sorting-associated protein 52
MGEVQRRGCAPLESFVFGIRLRMWPLFQKGMSEHVDALKKLVDGANAGTSMFFGRGTTITGDIVGGVSSSSYLFARYHFNSFFLDLQKICSVV